MCSYFVIYGRKVPGWIRSINECFVVFLVQCGAVWHSMRLAAF